MVYIVDHVLSLSIVKRNQDIPFDWVVLLVLLFGGFTGAKRIWKMTGKDQRESFQKYCLLHRTNTFFFIILLAGLSTSTIPRRLVSWKADRIVQPTV